MFFCWDHWHSIIHYTNLWHLSLIDFLPNMTILLIIGFHKASATGVACRQGTLTPPDTWSCPTLGLACVRMLRPIFSELVLSPDLWISNTPRYFSFASHQIIPKFLSQGCLMTFCNLTKYNDNPRSIRVCTNLLPILVTELDLLLTYEKFPLDICDGCSMLTGEAYSFWHLLPSYLVLPYVLIVDTNLFPERVVISSGLLLTNSIHERRGNKRALHKRRKRDKVINIKHINICRAKKLSTICILNLPVGTPGLKIICPPYPQHVVKAD